MDEKKSLTLKCLTAFDDNRKLIIGKIKFYQIWLSDVNQLVNIKTSKAT